MENTIIFVVILMSNLTKKQYSQEFAKLKKAIRESVGDMLTTQDSYGRFATYSIESEFKSWDLWSRKYVMLGMQYFYEICPEEAQQPDNLAVKLRQKLQKKGKGERKDGE